MVEIEAKDADSSVVASSKTSEAEYKLPPKVQVDDYQDAFRHTYMGPNSKSFVNLTTAVEKPRENKKEKLKRANDYTYKKSSKRRSNNNSMISEYKMVKHPKSGMMLPKHVETYDQVIKRLNKIKAL
jgi:hypothetical protein